MNGHTAATVAAVALVTALLRFAPFLLFPAGKPRPKYILYLSRVLPPAVIGMLVVYCLRHINFLSAPFALPELLSLALVAGSYVWKRSTLFSIASGTLCYMILLRLMV